MISSLKLMSIGSKYLFDLVTALEAAYIALTSLPGFDYPSGGGGSKKREGDECYYDLSSINIRCGIISPIVRRVGHNVAVCCSNGDIYTTTGSLAM